MTNAICPSDISIGLPRSRVIVTPRPSKARAAVPPIATTSFGRSRTSSTSSQKRHAWISGGSGRLVDAPLAARLELEVLHSVGDVDRATVDARLLHCAVEELPGRPDERFAYQVFLVAWRSPTNSTLA